MKNVDKIGIIYNPYSKKAFKAAINLVRDAKRLGISCVVDSEYWQAEFMAEKASLKTANIDVVVSIGGDGTLLRALHRILPRNIPLMGITVNTLGFLNEVPLSKANYALQMLKEGRYWVEKRRLVEGKWRHQTILALNEIAILSEIPCKTVLLEVLVDGASVIYGKMDGVLVASATGSTAYSLSAGGPVVDPELDVLVITPVSPVNLSLRSLVVPPSRRVLINVLRGKAVMVGDGIKYAKILKSNLVTIGLSALTASFVRLENISSYYSKLSERLTFKA